MLHPSNIDGTLDSYDELVGDLVICRGVQLSEHTHASVVRHPVEVGDMFLEKGMYLHRVGSSWRVLCLW